MREDLEYVGLDAGTKRNSGCCWACSWDRPATASSFFSLGSALGVILRTELLVPPLCPSSCWNSQGKVTFPRMVQLTNQRPRVMLSTVTQTCVTVLFCFPKANCYSGPSWPLVSPWLASSAALLLNLVSFLALF